MPASAMEQPFTVDELLTGSLWSLQSPTPQPPVDGDCGSAAAACEVAATVGGGAAVTDQSPSEWSFEEFLEEQLMEITTPVDVDAGVLGTRTEPVPDAVAVETAPVTTDPVEYNAMLKRKLEEDLSAIAMWRASGTPHPEMFQGLCANNGESKNLEQNKSTNGRGRPVQKAYVCTKLPASSSSMEPSLSEDDDVDGEVEILGIRRPDPERVKRRKQSNRESARRSRTRKAAHLKEIEEQVTLLRVENTLLLRRIGEINQLYSAAAIDNRVLRAEMETLRTKVQVKMAEETVSRLIGASPPLPSDVVINTNTPPSFNSVPFVGAPSHAAPPDPSLPVIQTSYYAAASDAAAAVATVGNTGSYMPASVVAVAPSPLQAEGAIVGNGTSSSATQMNRVADLHCAMEILEKRVMCDTLGCSSPGEAAPPPAGLDEVADGNMEGF